MTDDDDRDFADKEAHSKPDRSHTRGGTFSASTPVTLVAQDEIVISNPATSAGAHTFTFTPRGSGGSGQTFTETLGAGSSCRYSGRGIQQVTIDSTDAAVTWKAGPRGSVFAITNPSPGGGALAAAAVFVGDQGNYNPSSTGAFLMAGFGTNWKITPKTSGKVLLSWYGHYAPNVAGELAVKVAFGTGSAPAQNAAATGTAVGGSQLAEETSGTALLPGCIVVLVTGLTPGTAYWFDLQVEITNAADILHTGGLTAHEIVN